MRDTPPEQRQGLQGIDEPLPMMFEKDRVTRTFQSETDLTIKMKWKSLKTGNIFGLRATPEHPFFVPAEDRYIAIKDLEIGDRCVSKSGYLVELIEKEYVHERIKVYNIEVENHHNYFVGSNDYENILVHNKCSCPDEKLAGYHSALCTCICHNIPPASAIGYPPLNILTVGHPGLGGSNVGMVDGTVRHINNKIAPEVLAAQQRNAIPQNINKNTVPINQYYVEVDNTLPDLAVSANERR